MEYGEYVQGCIKNTTQNQRHNKNSIVTHFSVLAERYIYYCMYATSVQNQHFFTFSVRNILKKEKNKVNQKAEKTHSVQFNFLFFALLTYSFCFTLIVLFSAISSSLFSSYMLFFCSHIKAEYSICLRSL